MHIRLTLYGLTFIIFSFTSFVFCSSPATTESTFGLFQNIFSSGDNDGAPSQFITTQHSGSKALPYTDPTIAGVTSASWPFSLLAFVKLKAH